MSQNTRKKFLTYDEQIELLESKKLQIHNKKLAVEMLKEYSYYSLITGYKDVFKSQRNGDYLPDATFEKIVSLYTFDDYLRNLVLHEIIRIEKHIKSLYSYSFCETYGDSQSDYLNVTNYNYSKHQIEINKFVSIVQDLLNHSDRYTYIHYNINKYGTVPLWILINALTFGNVSKMYNFSEQKLQSKIAREFENVYPHELSSMLNVLTKFRNVCAHGERLYNYKTNNSIKSLPIHSNIENYNPTSKNDLFNVLICFKYLSFKEDFKSFMGALNELLDILKNLLDDKYFSNIIKSMGFPDNWKDIITLEK